MSVSERCLRPPLKKSIGGRICVRLILDSGPDLDLGLSLTQYLPWINHREIPAERDVLQAQEEGFLTNILVPEGELVDVHTPVAIMCEAEDAVKELAENQKLVHEIVSEQKESLKALTWQSYLKESSGPKGCS